MEVKNLYASVGGKEILKGVNLKVGQGEVHSLMGPNGSGKSTLSLAIMGHPKYVIMKGDILLDGKSILGLTADERARKGLFLAFQQPVEVPGVSVSKFLLNALAARKANGANGGTGAAAGAPKFPTFVSDLRSALAESGLEEDFVKRQLNVGFSGGEKKRNEILQMRVLNPKIAVLDEIDSGLDVDALKTVARAVRAQARESGVLVITHYQRILKHLNPDFVHVMVGGRIVKSGGHALAAEIEENGYAGLEAERNQAEVR